MYFGSKVFKIFTKKITGKYLSVKKIDGKRIMDNEEGNSQVLNLLNKNKPFMVGRFGSSEIQTINRYVQKKLNIIKEYKNTNRQAICDNAGFFPCKDDLIDRFSEMMIEYSSQLDLLALLKNHDEGYVVKAHAKAAQLTHLRGIEPYYHNNPWSQALSGKKVLVIHPFEKTIKSQYEKRELLFANPRVLPEFELLTLKAIQTIAGEKSNFNTWFEALDYMTEEALKINFDIAIIGCGAYGFPLAARLKMNGKQAIHLGGATQILFGIRGNRWDNHDYISKLYNENWVRPSADEVPQNFKKVEGGCYW